MAWDRTSLVFSLPMASWSRGNMPASYNVGIVPSAPGGAWQPCTLTNMGGGYGVVNPGSGLGHLRFDSVNDMVYINKYLSWSNTSKITFEAKVDYVAGAVNEIIYSSYQAGSIAYSIFYLSSAARTVRFAVKRGATTLFVATNETLSDGPHTLAFRKDGATMTLWIDGVEATYSTQDSYNVGEFTETLPFVVGGDYRSLYSWSEKMQIFNTYDDAISGARMVANHALGNDMGEVANNVGDVMSFGGGGAKRIVPAGIFEGSM